MRFLAVEKPARLPVRETVRVVQRPDEFAKISLTCFPVVVSQTRTVSSWPTVTTFFGRLKTVRSTPTHVSRQPGHVASVDRIRNDRGTTVGVNQSPTVTGKDAK